MVLDCPCLALEAQLIQNLLNKPLTKFGTLKPCVLDAEFTKRTCNFDQELVPLTEDNAFGR